MFKMGLIVSLNETVNKIKVRDLFDNAILDIALDNTAQWQTMPVVGDVVLYVNFEDKIIKVVKVWSVNPNAFVRGGDFPLREGETQLMGILGQYMYLDRLGTIKFVDATLLNFFELNETGLETQVKALNFTTYDGVNVVIDKDIKISRDKKLNKTITQQQAMESQGQQPSTADREFQLTIDDNGVDLKRKGVEILIDANNQISINGAKLALCGMASDQTLGDVVTGGAFGTLPFCLVTGAPIIGSTTVKAKR